MKQDLLALFGLLSFAACGHSHDLPTLPKGGLDQQGSALYVALGKLGAIAVIDVASWKVAGTVMLSSKYFPHHLSLSPDGTRVAIGAPFADLSGGHGMHGAGADGALFLMDPRSADVTAQRALSGSAHNVGFIQDGAALAFALREDGALHLSDQGLHITATIAVGVEPLEATVVPDGRVLVANSGSGTVSVVDPRAQKVDKTLPVGKNPIGAWLGRDGRAYVTSESDKKLSAIALSDLMVERTIDLPGTPGQAATTIDGKELWVALEDQGKVLVLSTKDLSTEGEIVVGQRPHGLAVDPSGATIYLTDEAAGQIHALDVTGRRVLRSLTLGGAPNGILFRPAP